MLSVRKVSKYYHEADRDPVWALQRVSLEVPKGQFVCLVGPSGSGKTTLLNLVAGFLAPTEGEVLFKGERVVRPGPDRGVVFQEYALFPWLTVLDNVAFGLRNLGVPRRLARDRAFSALEQVGLIDFADARPHQLSGGMKQRVAIARVWALECELLLMDEPFGALDVGTRARMHDELIRIWQGSAKTILFVTHNVSEALTLADRVIVFSPCPGRVVADLAIDLPRPRVEAKSQVAAYEEAILAHLAEREGDAQDQEPTEAEGASSRLRSPSPIPGLP